MKKTLLLALFLSTQAIASTMSENDVLTEFNRLKNDKLNLTEKTESLSEIEQLRLDNLTPMNKFLPDSTKPYRARKSFNINRAIPLPNSVDLRARDTSIKSQDNGKCTAFSGVAAIENLMQIGGKIDGLNLSEWHAWSFYRQYSCEAFINALKKNFICEEKNFPQYGRLKAICSNNAKVKIKDVVYIDDNIDEMKAALARGSVVYLGMATPNDMLKCKSVISPNTSAANGGHALLISGYYTSGNETLAILKNSWGSDCGDRGYQYLPLSLCSKRGFYCAMWEIKSILLK